MAQVPTARGAVAPREARYLEEFFWGPYKINTLNPVAQSLGLGLVFSMLAPASVSGTSGASASFFSEAPRVSQTFLPGGRAFSAEQEPIQGQRSPRPSPSIKGLGCLSIQEPARSSEIPSIIAKLNEFVLLTQMDLLEFRS